jgi:methionyl-tRNA formyltransferase
MLQHCVAIAKDVAGVSVKEVFLKEKPTDPGRYLTTFFRKHDVECITYREIATVKAFLSRMPGKRDLLISVYNEDWVDSELLSCFIHKLNFHPSPLPRYGGLSPESWAILAGERVHGATWHVIAPKLDTGDIVSQKLFALDSSWTAYDVALECTRTGCRLFKPLLSDLAQNKLTCYPQDSGKSTYFTRKMVPFGGRFPFLAGYEAAERLRRATAYFPMPNPFCIPTINIGTTTIGLVRFSVRAGREVASPGTVIAVHDDGVSFAMVGGTMKVDLALLPGGRCARPTDSVVRGLLGVGCCAAIDDREYDAMGLSI